MYVIYRSAVLVPLLNVGKRPSVLFTVRSRFVSNHRGEIRYNLCFNTNLVSYAINCHVNHHIYSSFPGGIMDEDDEGSFLKTALREAEEEIGLQEKDVTIIGHLPLLSSRVDTLLTCLLF